jgi:DNA-binding NarL/FixJ family response regulator
MARLLKINLERRGFHVQSQPWAACCGLGDRPWQYTGNVVIADLDCPAPACWNAGPRLRAAYPHIPLLLLAHEHPSARYLRAHQPCGYLQKPFGVSDAVREIDAIFRSRS